MGARALVVGTVALWAAAAACAAAPTTVRVRVVDETSGATVPARVSLWRGSEAILPPGFSSYSRKDERHFLVAGEFALELAPGSYRLEAARGLEYVPAAVEFEVPRDGVVELPVRRWVAMNAAGWYSADMHVHRDPAEVPLALRAEDLNFVPTITTHVWSTEVNRPWPAPPEFPIAVEPGRLFTANGQEIERIQGGPGAVILLGRELPLPFEGYELYPPNASYARRVHAAGGYVEGDKLFWLDTAANAVLGHVDFVELNCNHFLPREVETDLVPWSHWPIELGYRGARGFALWMMELYYRLLNAGVELPLSAGTASGVKAAPVGYERVYARLGDQPFGYEAFMRALKDGRSFSTNGPVLELEVDGRYGPGERIALRPGQAYRVRARARSRGPLDRLELVANGEVAAARDGRDTDTRELTLGTTLRFDRSSWVALRAFERGKRVEAWQPAGFVFAHTSPLYFLLGKRPVVVRRSAEQLLSGLDQLIAHTRRLDGFRLESHRQETLDVYLAAKRRIRERLATAEPVSLPAPGAR